MVKNPDKWIRKGILTALGNNQPNTPPTFDMRVPGNTIPQYYILLSTQTKLDNENNKCSGQWDCTILLDINTRFGGQGNPGDRVQVNDLEEYVLSKMPDFTIQGFTVFKIVLESSTSFDNITDTMNIFRQIMRYRIILSENV